MHYQGEQYHMAVGNREQTSQWVAPVFFAFAFLIATLPTLIVLSRVWLSFDGSFSHGFLLLAVTVGLSVITWRRTRPEVGFYWPWLIPFVLSLLVYLSGRILMIETFQYLALMPILGSGLLLMWGWRQTVPFIIPVGLLIFAMPFWDYLSWPLQVVTVSINQLMLTPLNIEFVVEGVFVYFPGIGAFEIAHGCSGLRYLLVGVTLSTLYGELNYRFWRSRFVLIAMGILLSLIANWIRVFVIIYQGYETEMTSSLIADHDMFGWWVFAATLVPLFFFGRHLEKREDAQVARESSATPVQGNAPAARKSRPLVGGVGAVLPLVLVGLLAWSVSPSPQAGATSSTRPHEVQLVDGDQWMPLFQKRLHGWQPEIVKPDRILERTYKQRELAGEELGTGDGLFIGLYSYDYQRPGREAVQYENRVTGSRDMRPEQTFTVNAGDGVQLGGLSLRDRKSGEFIHLAYGYYVEGRWENTELQAKLAQLPGILNSRSDASLLVFAVACSECDEMEELSSMASSIRPTAQSYLDELYNQ
ncbi:exosortase [Marinobacter salicampi]|uniref:exosortase n=1 Tax=Marinobacter salicampi TaxID=435907 RepID=UPI001408121E|nr:exosortase [Marinobacter salicampi]